MRRAARIDGNHGEIVEALRKSGCSVTSLAGVGKGCPDLLVGLYANSYECGRRTLLLEVKDGNLPPSARKLTDDEERWHAEWRGEAYVVNSVSEALELIGEIRRGHI